MNTHTFKLPTGIECEVRELTGKEQKIITETNKKKYADKFSSMLNSVIIRVGSNTNVTEDFIKDEMLSCDKAFILSEVRQFSFDFDDTFNFSHTYRGDNNKKVVTEISETIPNGHFTFEAVKVAGEDGALIPATYKEYGEVKKNITIVLPRTKKKVRFTMLDGKGEQIGIAVNKNKRSSHTPLKMRNPVEFVISKKDNEVPLSLDLDSLPIKDIEFLRKAIKKWEGRTDTEIMFFNPSTEKDEVVDVVRQEAFFFPSEAI